MKSAIVKRTVRIAGHSTSISLEDEFWDSLQEIAESQSKPVSHLIASINAERKSTNLSSAVRLFVLGFIGISTAVENWSMSRFGSTHIKFLIIGSSSPTLRG